MIDENAGSITDFFPELKDQLFCLHVNAKPYQEQNAFHIIRAYHINTFGLLVVLNNCIIYTQRDNFTYHELMAHAALSSDKISQHLVVVDGFDCGPLREALCDPFVRTV